MMKFLFNRNRKQCHSDGAIATNESYNSFCSLFLFDFDAKRKSGTEKEKHERLNGSSYQGLSPRTPNHVITRKQAEQSMKQSIQSDVVISNKTHQCHPELVSGSQKLRRFRNKFGMTINNSEKDKKNNKNVKDLLPYFPFPYSP